MITEILNAFFIFSALIISAYLIRHYIFTLTVLRRAKNNKTSNTVPNETYKPTVSILIPAHNEEKVIAQLLQKMTEIAYPESKLEVVTVVPKLFGIVSFDRTFLVTFYVNYTAIDIDSN